MLYGSAGFKRAQVVVNFYLKTLDFDNPINGFGQRTAEGVIGLNRFSNRNSAKSFIGRSKI